MAQEVYCYTKARRKISHVNTPCRSYKCFRDKTFETAISWVDILQKWAQGMIYRF